MWLAGDLTLTYINRENYCNCNSAYPSNIVITLTAQNLLTLPLEIITYFYK